MTTNYIPRQRVQVEKYEMSYVYENDPGFGFAFDCDKNGVIAVEKMHEEGLKNLTLCMIGGVLGNRILPGILIDISYSYMESGSCKCDVCHAKVDLSDAFWNVCDNCGADFDGSGHLLAPHSQWGEETGERF